MDYPLRIVLLTPDSGGYVATVPSLPGCVSQGDTMAEAVANIREAIRLYIEVLREDGRPVPGGDTE